MCLHMASCCSKKSARVVDDVSCVIGETSTSGIDRTEEEHATHGENDVMARPRVDGLIIG